jgi:subtilisin family serine protease
VARVVLAALLACAVQASAASPDGTVEVVYPTAAAYAAGAAAHAGAVVRAVPELRLLEVRASRLRGSRGAVVRRTVVRTSAGAGAPALTLGQVSTPAGGAYEWQWYATHADGVPASVLAAAAGTTIAIVDTGVDVSSPALAGKVAGSLDTRTGKPGVADETGHGTFVASIAGGTGAMAGFGGAARLLVVKVGEGDRVNDVDVSAGIVAAVKRGARVVNVSIAGPARSAAEESAVTYAAKRGALLVAPVGNDALSGNAPRYPAALLRAGAAGLAVGASDSTGARAPFSEYGPFVSIAAPGANVFGAFSRAARVPLGAATPMLGGSYGFASGTSFAAPQVAGAAALVWAANPTLTARQVAGLLQRTAGGKGTWSPELGSGVLDVAAAVAAAARSRP